MKTNLLKLTCALGLSFTAHASQLTWVKTPFWSAPQVTNFEVKFTEPGMEIRENCKRYSKLIFSDDGTMNWPNQPERVERFRTTLMANSPMDVQHFEVYLQIGTPLERSAYLEEEVTLPVDPKNESDDVLPHFTQTKSYSGAYLAEITDFDIKIRNEKLSLAKASRSLGLDDSKVEITRNSRGLLGVKIYGRDLACDLLDGKVELVAKVPGYVGIEKEQMTKLSDFYHGKLEDELNRILSVKDEAITFKAARLGFNLGRILDEEFKNPELEFTEKRIKAIFELVFKPKTLNMTSNLVDINKRMTFNLTSNAEGSPAVVRFSF